MLVRKVASNEEQVRAFLEDLFEADRHAKRGLSLAHATLGVVHAALSSLHAIGRALAWARGCVQKYGITHWLGGRRGKPRYGEWAEGQHGEDSHLLTFPSGLHVLPNHPDDEGGATAALVKCFSELHHRHTAFQEALGFT